MPKPNKHVFICTQTRPPGHPRGSCGENGARDLWDAFLSEFERRQLFEEVALTNTGCLGPCFSGANVLVYPEGVMYGGVKPSDVAEIFESHLVNDKPVERLKVSEEVWG